ncbi:hypothetical protein [Paraburkholderia sp. J67]|nr:hypothetical protein [Paraburkholderia sp. J67]
MNTVTAIDSPTGAEPTLPTAAMACSAREQSETSFSILQDPKETT